MSTEAKGRKQLGFWGDFGFGCVLDIVLMVGFICAVEESTWLSAVYYATMLSVLVWGLRWLLNQFDLLGGWCGRLIGPVVLVGAMLLAVFFPHKINQQTDTGDESASGATNEVEEVVSSGATNEVKEVVSSGATNGVKAVVSAGATNEVVVLDRETSSDVQNAQASTNDVSVEAALAELDGLVGLKPVKEEVARFVKFVRVAQQRKAAGLKVAPISYHMVFTGNPGTGKTTVARIVAKIYRALGVVKKGHLVECDRGALVAGYTGQTAIKTGKVIDSALDGILFIDEAYSLVNGPQDAYGAEAISTLLKRMEDDRDRLVVIVAGYTDEMKKFFGSNSGLASRFNHYIEFPDYTSEELAAIFRMNAKKSQYVLSADAERGLVAFIAAQTLNRDSKFGNGRWVRNLFEQAVAHQAERVADIANPTLEQLTTIEMRDIGELGKGNADLGASGLARTPPPGVRYMPAATNEVSVEAALMELNDLVGLKPVKKQVEEFAAFVRVAQQRKAAGLKVAPISYHMVFTGNPGTGKTTVARIMAKIYKALGVVRNGHLVECDRGALVAGYAGQTAIKTGQVIDFALDGILFIDEAYSLVNGPQDSYGTEAISTLLKRMEDDRDRLVVIVAGYTEEMKTFIDANSGLASRFTHYVEFPDYTAEELAEMFRKNAKKSQYVLSADVEKWLDAFIRVRTKKRDRKFGNGRWARTLFEEAVSRQAVRVSKLANPTPEQLKTLTMKDVGIKLKDPNASKED